MKRIFAPVLLVVLLAACRSNDKQAAKDSLNTPIGADKNSAETQSLIKKFKPIIQGVWVKEDYIKKVIATKSPLAAADKALDITIFFIDTLKIKEGTIIVPLASGNHDGSDLTLTFKSGKNPSTLLFGEGELSYSVANGDTTLIYSQLGKNLKLIETRFIRSYKKLPNNEFASGMNFYINKLLVKGTYHLIDSTKTNSMVSLSEDGKVNGFFNFKNYEINIDINSGVNDNLDEITFSEKDGKYSSYSFKINADTLNLYSTYENADSTELILGKLKYKLVRQK